MQCPFFSVVCHMARTISMAFSMPLAFFPRMERFLCIPYGIPCFNQFSSRIRAPEKLMFFSKVHFYGVPHLCYVPMRLQVTWESQQVSLYSYSIFLRSLIQQCISYEPSSLIIVLPESKFIYVQVLGVRLDEQK